MAGQSISKGAITLTTDASKLQAGLKAAQAQIAQFSSSVTGLMKFQVGLDVFDRIKGAMTGLLSQIQQTGDRAETLLANAMAFGTTAENLQNLSGAAQLAGVDTEKFNEILRVAADVAGEASLNTEEVAKKLRQIGLATTDLAGQSGTDALEILLKAFKGVANESERIHAIGDLLGARRTLQVVKLLNADLDELQDKFKQMGMTFTKEQLEQMDEAGDKAQLVGKKFGYVWDRVIGGIGSALDKAAEFREEVKGWFGSSPGAGTVEQLAQFAAEEQDYYDAASKFLDKQNAIQAKQEAARIKMQEDFQSRMRLEEMTEQATKGLDAAQKFLDFTTPTEQATLAINHMLGLMDAGILRAEEFNMAIEKMGKEFNEITSGENRLPGAAFRGSIEDVSAKIQASVRSGESDNRMVQNLLRDIVENTKPLKNIDGVQN